MEAALDHGRQEGFEIRVCRQAGTKGALERQAEPVGDPTACLSGGVKPPSPTWDRSLSRASRLPAGRQENGPDGRSVLHLVFKILSCVFSCSTDTYSTRELDSL